jgi:hypothetical protein
MFLLWLIYDLIISTIVDIILKTSPSFVLVKYNPSAVKSREKLLFRNKIKNYLYINKI